MLIEITIIIILALVLNYFFTKIHLPGLLGMVLTGIVLGPGMLNVIGEELLVILREFKTVALIIILIRAGLGIKRKTLQQIGGPAIRLGFIPCIIEGVAIMFIAHFLLNFTLLEAGILGFIVAAVSPAVVVPQMLEFKEAGLGKRKEIPTLVLAGASLDDIFALTIFGIFISLASGSAVNIIQLAITVPLGIVAGALLGVLIGFILIWFFKKYHIRDTKKVLIFMVIAVLFYEFSEWDRIKDILPIAGLLGIMAIGFMLLEKYDVLANRLAVKFNKLWVLAEILLFVYIGSEVDFSLIDSSFILVGLLILTVGLLFRSGGVLLSLIGSNLNAKEKLFCVVSYFPKATVQAAIGAVPLTLIQAGEITSISETTGLIILTIAVLSIVVTAPLGAILVKLLVNSILERG